MSGSLRATSGLRPAGIAAFRAPLALRHTRYVSTRSSLSGESVAPLVTVTPTEVKKPAVSAHSVIPTGILLRSLLVTTVSSHPLLLGSSLSILSFLTKSRSLLLDVERNPLIHWVLRKTFYDHFCAGEREAEVHKTIEQIKSTGVKGVILTYTRETVQDSRTEQQRFANTKALEKAASTDTCEHIEAWREDVLRTVDMLGPGDFLAPKLTGAGPKVTQAFAAGQPVPTQMVEALDEVCRRVVEKKARLLMDAEQHAFLQGIHSLTLDMMRKYNRGGEAVIYNTFQAYLKAAPELIASHLKLAHEEGFTLGLKLVRGAYMSSDPRHLIHDTKENTDQAYDTIVRGILQQNYKGFGEKGRPFPATDLFLATHNVESAVAAHNLHQTRVRDNLPTCKVEFGQLMGMADGVTYGLLQLRGQNRAPPAVYKCLHWGSLSECLSFLLRRAAENRDAVSRTMTEHEALKAEVKRRIRAVFSRS
ncbi:FAD-linked oxidoreductase [Aspergillus saccharolyticus JOP 1030-1]|uniref:Proline dehydrogenase n=1 Tax=Aspergillus saccharolyticus JOP 1030-1 TaxID=1450539 RepID=A0A318ZMY7_9EURO|nr:FAD-linked oxidoreductase [Aspergillus saccharolyticus JOP 1030-1]PYH48959.1 FAD-linked oxidoreductase [Aspergillus saccharolyticus JOP 1030-1]